MLRVAVGLALCGQATASAQGEDEYKLAFDEFVNKYHKDYATVEERATRFAAFKDNYDKIVAHRSGGHSYEVGLSPFADLTPDEFNQGYTSQFLAVPPPNETLMALEPRLNSTLLPESVDWRSSGAVTPVKNQGHCGSCWSFASTGALEGRWQIKTGQLVSLSEQLLIDCVSDAAGCNGGSMDVAFRWAESHPLCTESGAPYKAAQGTCASDDNCKVGIPQGGVQGFQQVAVHDDYMMTAVSQGPVSIGFHASTMVQLYTSGVFHGSCETRPNHGVLVVGYGKADRDYWLVKNSWGPSWGEDGYFRIVRGQQGSQCASMSNHACDSSSYCEKSWFGKCHYVGECGLLTMSFYPVMNGGVDVLLV